MGAEAVRTSPVMQADELTRHYRVRSNWWRAPDVVRALNGVSFSLAAGRTLAVVGESGCGKSTLARLLTLVEAPSSGQLRVGGVAMESASAAQRRSLRPKVQMVFQNPYTSLNPRRRIGATLEEPLVIHGRGSAAERRETAAAWLDRVGLRPEHLDRYPHMFSGGQRQRVAIARAMLLQPEVLVADEPVSALDVSIQAQILNLMQDLQAQWGTAYVFISHNLSVVRHVAHDIMVMYLGRVVERGPAAAVFDRPRHPYTRALVSATPSLRRQPGHQRIQLRGELPSPLQVHRGCAFAGRCPHAQARCHEEAPALREDAGHAVACHFDLNLTRGSHV